MADSTARGRFHLAGSLSSHTVPPSAVSTSCLHGYLHKAAFKANLKSVTSGHVTRGGTPMRTKTTLLNLLTLVALLLTGALAVAAAEPPASAPISSAPEVFLSTLSAAQPSPCNATAPAAERAIFSPSPEDLAPAICGACSGVCAGLSRRSLCALGGGTGPKYCMVSEEICIEDNRAACNCGAP
jgi:hypothetical protein